ncbi:hypothetical protein CWI37_0391p0030 [Hamiltosporidium tvaerminnensis]|uniref:Uncharacterized protein n=1 Tax=Hamiltosporidium tvaerminnensis TaxID=1176355 RepID=A0A4Q9L5N9_9MICR|nr:hypothetical protein LUQ84_003190 [Hamiltosporidium tvaerminnensis]TBU02919.1 hypothetical protein CWI37_0391p0030 [Hamiltosporidium tvaerminnensis]
MQAPVFPLFNLKFYKGKVFACGGGGDTRFGKSNGIIVLDSTTYEDISYFESSDLLINLKIYDPTEIRDELQEDTISFVEEERKIQQSEPKVELEETEIEKRLYSKTNDMLYIATYGTDYFYLLSFSTNKFEILSKLKIKITHVFFNCYMFIQTDTQVYGFSNPTSDPTALKRLKYLIKKPTNHPNSPKKNTSDEFIYSTFKNNKYIKFRKENNDSIIKQDFSTYFITYNKIHKILLINHKYTFIFQNVKREYSDEIKEIFYNRRNKLLVFYLKGINSTLHFIDKSNQEYIFKISKITCINVNKKHVSVGTGDGYIHVFRDNVFIIKRRVTDVPITGVDYNEGFVYFCTFYGAIDRKKIDKFEWWTLVLLFAIIAIILGLVRYKD